MNCHLLLVGGIDGTLTFFSNEPGLPFSYQKRYYQVLKKGTEAKKGELKH